MKKIYIVIIGLFLLLDLQAQVEKTIECTPGSLDTLLIDTELATVTHLTITGTIDASDFKTMRDRMPFLSVLDIGAANITGYKEAVFDIVYPANEIPASYPFRPSEVDHSFSEKTSLTSIILPATVNAIGSEAFRNCTGLVSVEFPSGLTSIGQGAFKGCTSILSLDLPSSLTVMGWESFSNCSSLVSATIPSSMTYVARSAFEECTSLKTVVIPSSVIEIRPYAFYNCISLDSVEFPHSLITIDDLSFARCRSLSSAIIPSSVKTIGMSAFTECSSLSKLLLPRNIQKIGLAAFVDCINLSAIYAFHSNPLELPMSNTGVFYNVDTTNCTLYVPAGSKDLYASAEQWKDFQHIVEMSLFKLPDSTIVMQADQQTAYFDLETNGDWTAHTDQTWLTLTPLSGTGNQTFTLTAEKNTSPAIQTATVQISIADSITQDITVIQKGVPVEINVNEAGTLAEQLQGIDISTLSELVLTGEIDARDFVIIRDQMPLLEVLDLRGASIKAYSGSGGTFSILDTWDYPADELPDYALQEGWLTHRKDKLTTLYLPETSTSVGSEALSNCIGLQEVIFPPSVVNIDFRAFGSCSSLKSVVLPNVSTIGPKAFEGCLSLAEIQMPSVTIINKSAFQSCPKLTSVVLPNTLNILGEGAFYMCLGLESVDFGDSLTTIGPQAFFECISLKTISIPNSVTSIGYQAFYTINLESVYCYAERPIDLSDPKSFDVFANVDKSSCILYVPFGSREYYEEAIQWKDFEHIVEMDGFELSYTELTFGAGPHGKPIEINTNMTWTAASDQEWLEVSPASGNSSQTIMVKVLENPSYDVRKGMVTFLIGNATSQTVTVTQRARVNSSPMANAGADQEVEEGTVVQLDGTASTDADNDTLIYEWTAPAGIILSSASDARPTFTAPQVGQKTAFTFKLIVNDGKETSISDRVIVTVTNKIIFLSLSEDSIAFDNKESEAKITVTSNAEWVVNSNQTWLTASPDKGQDNGMFTLTAAANKEVTERKATVIVSAPETEDQILVVTQKGLITEVAGTAQNSPLMSYYPNPFKENLTITISNHEKQKMTVDIYNLSGQKVKNLTTGNKAEKISLHWNGSDERGQQVPQGMYLLKVNEAVRTVVKGMYSVTIH